MMPCPCPKDDMTADTYILVLRKVDQMVVKAQVSAAQKLPLSLELGGMPWRDGIR